MNRSIFFPIWLVLLASCDKMDISPAQADSFIKFYNTFPVFTGADVKEIPGIGYVIVGTVVSNTEGKQICLIRTDLYGNSIDSAKYYGFRLDDQAYRVEVLEDRGFAILGSTVDTITEKKSVYLIRTDSVGNEVWHKIIRGTTNNTTNFNTEAFHFEVDAAGSFFMVGYGETTRNGNPLNKDIWLDALDKDGNNLWANPRYIGLEHDDIGYDLHLLPDGKIIITGESTNSSGQAQAFLLRTGSNGFGEGFFTIPSAGSEVGNCIQVVDENTFIITGTTRYASVSTGSDIMLKKVTYSVSGLDTLWTRKYGKGNDEGVCVILDDVNLHLLTTTASAGINTTITLITTDLEGKNPVYSEIGNGSQLSGAAFEKTTDNGFIITGTNQHSDNDMSMTLIKVKSGTSLW